MASFTYLEPANANLVCCICRSPFVEPCTTRTCCHTFCYDCIAQAIAINRQCPIDRTPLSLNHLTPADPVIRNLVDELVVACPQQPLGCSYTCQRVLVPGHLKDLCQYVQLPCPEARCSQSILRKDLGDHHCSQSATDTSTTSNNPSETRSREDEDLQDKAAKSAAPSSASSAPATESTSDLAAENAMLRLRLSALENVVHTLRNQMFAVKHALGPWYRPDLQPELPPEDQQEDFAATAAFEHQLAQDLAAAPTATLPENGSSVSRDSVDIASYFPPLEENMPRATFSQSRHRNASSTSSAYHPRPSVGQGHVPLSPPASAYPSLHQSAPLNTIYGSPPFPASGQAPGMPYTQTSFSASSLATFSIPPLDPTTSLPDTLATLHSSLVTVAGAHGALAAARAAESLRTTEELRGLRAATHGLRMQVHDILTSRTPLAGNGVPRSGEDVDANEQTSFHLGRPAWTGFGLPRPYGIPPAHHSHYPPSFGGPVIPPTNITKL